MTRFSRNAVRNSAIGLVAQIAIKVISFLFSILIVRRLGAEQYGQYAAVLAFGGVFVFIADLGLGPYTVRTIARLHDDPQGDGPIRTLFGNVLWLRLGLALLAGSLIILTAWLTGRSLEMVVAVTLGALGLLLYGIQGASEAILSGHERLDFAAAARVIQQLIFVLLGGTALWFGIGYFGLIFANLAGVLLLTLVCWRGVKNLQLNPGPVEVRLWPSLLRRSLPFGVIGFTLGLSYKFDSVLLNVHFGDGPTGYYNAAYTLIFAAVMFSNTINTALYPSLARQAASEPAALPQIYQRVFTYLMLLAMPITVGIWLLAEPLIALLYGADYGPTTMVLQMIIWVLPLMYLSEFLGYMVLVAGRETNVARAVLVSTGFNVLLNFLLIPRYGIFAAAAMTVATEAVLTVQYLWLLRRHVDFQQWGQIGLRLLTATAGMAAVILFVMHHLPLLVTVGLAALTYLLLLLLLGVVGTNEWQFVRTLRQAPPHHPAQAKF